MYEKKRSSAEDAGVCVRLSARGCVIRRRVSSITGDQATSGYRESPKHRGGGAEREGERGVLRSEQGRVSARERMSRHSRSQNCHVFYLRGERVLSRDTLGRCRRRRRGVVVDGATPGGGAGTVAVETGRLGWAGLCRVRRSISLSVKWKTSVLPLGRDNSSSSDCATLIMRAVHTI
jgi:hypothetical protein